MLLRYKDGIGNLEEVGVAERHPDVFGLPSGEAASEAREIDQPSKGLALELFLQHGRVRVVAHAREAFFTE